MRYKTFTYAKEYFEKLSSFFQPLEIVGSVQRTDGIRSVSTRLRGTDWKAKQTGTHGGIGVRNSRYVNDRPQRGELSANNEHYGSRWEGSKLINVTSRRNRFFPLLPLADAIFERSISRLGDFRFWNSDLDVRTNAGKSTRITWHGGIFRIRVWKYNFVLDIDWTETLYLGGVEIRAACESCVSAVTLWLSSFYKLWKGNSSEAGMIPGWPTISYSHSRNAITLDRNGGK